MNRLEGKIALVTGSARGIGRATVELLAAHGAAMVISCDMVETSFEQENIRHEILDVTDREQIKELVSKIEKEYGKIDILVNNAGITKDNIFLRMSEEQWDAVINVNLKGVFNVTQAVAKGMLKKRKRFDYYLIFCSGNLWKYRTNKLFCNERWSHFDDKNLGERIDTKRSSNQSELCCTGIY